MASSTNDISTTTSTQRDLAAMLVTQTLSFVTAIAVTIGLYLAGWHPWQKPVDGWKTLAFFLAFGFVFVTLGSACVAWAFQLTSWRARALAKGAEFIEATQVSYMMMMLAVAGAISRAAAPLLSDPGTSHAVMNLAQSELGLGAAGFAIFKLTVIRLPTATESKKP